MNDEPVAGHQQMWYGRNMPPRMPWIRCLGRTSALWSETPRDNPTMRRGNVGRKIQFPATPQRVA